MAICIDRKNDTYYITYKIKLSNGSRKSRTIRNKERKVTGANKVSKRYLQRIQASVIAEDYHNLEKVSEIKPNKNPSLKEVATLYLDYITLDMLEQSSMENYYKAKHALKQSYIENQGEQTLTSTGPKKILRRIFKRNK